MLHCINMSNEDVKSLFKTVFPSYDFEETEIINEFVNMDLKERSSIVEYLSHSELEMLVIGLSKVVDLYSLKAFGRN